MPSRDYEKEARVFANAREAEALAAAIALVSRSYSDLTAESKRLEKELEDIQAQLSREIKSGAATAQTIDKLRHEVDLASKAFHKAQSDVSSYSNALDKLSKNHTHVTRQITDVIRQVKNLSSTLEGMGGAVGGTVGLVLEIVATLKSLMTALISATDEEAKFSIAIERTTHSISTSPAAYQRNIDSLLTLKNTLRLTREEMLDFSGAIEGAAAAGVPIKEFEKAARQLQNLRGHAEGLKTAKALAGVSAEDIRLAQQGAGVNQGEFAKMITRYSPEQGQALQELNRAAGITPANQGAAQKLTEGQALLAQFKDDLSAIMGEGGIQAVAQLEAKYFELFADFLQSIVRSMDEIKNILITGFGITKKAVDVAVGATVGGAAVGGGKVAGSVAGAAVGLGLVKRPRIIHAAGGPGAPAGAVVPAGAGAGAAVPVPPGIDPNDWRAKIFKRIPEEQQKLGAAGGISNSAFEAARFRADTAAFHNAASGAGMRAPVVAGRAATAQMELGAALGNQAKLNELSKARVEGIYEEVNAIEEVAGQRRRIAAEERKTYLDDFNNAKDKIAAKRTYDQQIAEVEKREMLALAEEAEALNKAFAALDTEMARMLATASKTGAFRISAARTERLEAEERLATAKGMTPDDARRIFGGMVAAAETRAKEEREKLPGVIKGLEGIRDKVLNRPGATAEEKAEARTKFEENRERAMKNVASAEAAVVEQRNQAIQKELDVTRRRLNVERSIAEIQQSTAEFVGGSYQTILAMQQKVVSLKTAEFNTDMQELRNLRARGELNARDQQRVQELEIKTAQEQAEIFKATIGLQKNFLDQAIGQMFGVNKGTKFQPSFTDRALFGEHSIFQGMMMRGVVTPAQQRAAMQAGVLGGLPAPGGAGAGGGGFFNIPPVGPAGGPGAGGPGAVVPGAAMGGGKAEIALAINLNTDLFKAAIEKIANKVHRVNIVADIRSGLLLSGKRGMG